MVEEDKSLFDDLLPEHGLEDGKLEEPTEVVDWNEFGGTGEITDTLSVGPYTNVVDESILKGFTGLLNHTLIGSGIKRGLGWWHSDDEEPKKSIEEIKEQTGLEVSKPMGQSEINFYVKYNSMQDALEERVNQGLGNAPTSLSKFSIFTAGMAGMAIPDAVALGGVVKGVAKIPGISNLAGKLVGKVNGKLLPVTDTIAKRGAAYAQIARGAKLNPLSAKSFDKVGSAASALGKFAAKGAAHGGVNALEEYIIWKSEKGVGRETDLVSNLRMAAIAPMFLSGVSVAFSKGFKTIRHIGGKIAPNRLQGKLSKINTIKSDLFSKIKDLESKKAAGDIVDGDLSKTRAELLDILNLEKAYMHSVNLGKLKAYYKKHNLGEVPEAAYAADYFHSAVTGLKTRDTFKDAFGKTHEIEYDWGGVRPREADEIKSYIDEYGHHTNSYSYARHLEADVLSGKYNLDDAVNKANYDGAQAYGRLYEFSKGVSDDFIAGITYNFRRSGGDFSKFDFDEVFPFMRSIDDLKVELDRLVDNGSIRLNSKGDYILNKDALNKLFNKSSDDLFKYFKSKQDEGIAEIRRNREVVDQTETKSADVLNKERLESAELVGNRLERSAAPSFKKASDEMDTLIRCLLTGGI